MTTPKRRPCHWPELAASCIVAAIGAIPSASAALSTELPEQNPIFGVATQEDLNPPAEDLYLEIVLNQARLRQLAHFVYRDGQLYAEARTLLDLGLTWPGASADQGLVALNSLPGLHAEYDVADQTLDISVPIDLLSGTTAALGYHTPPVPQIDPATRAPGLLLNYDAYAQKDSNFRSISGWSELRLFGVGPGVWRASNLLQSTSDNYSGDRFKSTRLDTSWQLDFPESMVSVTVGDAYSGGLAWTRITRFGGLRVARNFNLQPYRVTVPLQSFAGDATLPSIVDLYINGVREAQSRVAPGQFQMVSAPVITGAGNAQMVITDITGQTRVVNFSIYNSASLLQQGLGDWSFEVGKLREDYGVRSFSYVNDVMYSASARYGLTDHITVEAHGEGSDGLTMGGVGAAARLGQLGVVNASYASSNYESRRGNQYGVGYEWRGRKLSMNLSTLRRDRAFQDVGSLVGSSLPLSTTQAFVGWTIGSGQLGASYIRQEYRDSPRANYLGVSWSQSLGRFGYFNIGVNRDLGGSDGTSAFAYWSLPLGDRRQAWASVERQKPGTSSTLGVSQNTPGDADGWGWRVQASAGQESSGQGEVSQLTRYGEWRAGVQHWRSSDYGNDTTAYAGATGGLLLMEGSVFPMRRVYDSFALVSTDGIPDVPVKLENRFIGNTDDDGLLLVSPLNAWQNNDLSIDPLSLPADVHVDHVRMKAVPATGSGMIARFPMKTTLTVELSVRPSSGEVIPPGTDAVLMPGNVDVAVGYDGRVYMEDPPAGGKLIVPSETGECVVELPADLPARGRFDLGEQPCR